MNNTSINKDMDNTIINKDMDNTIINKDMDNTRINKDMDIIFILLISYMIFLFNYIKINNPSYFTKINIENNINNFDKSSKTEENTDILNINILNINLLTS